MCSHRLLLLVATCLSVIYTKAEDPPYRTFPSDFLIGAASSSYQVEGAWNEDGKGQSVLDFGLHLVPSFIVDGTNGDTASDSYHKYKEDVEVLSELGMDFYRFSISWSRVLPNGYITDINPKGIEYYNNLIDELISRNITPMVALYHWDLPLNLQLEGGWANPKIIDTFLDYAKLMLTTYGDRVKWWVTMVEPLVISDIYTNFLGLQSDVYKLGHNMILTHAKTYHMYKEMLQENETEGNMGIALLTYWEEPLTNSTEDIEAANRALQFRVGWFAHPIFSEAGDYPPLMRERVDALSQADGEPESRLPYFIPEEIELVKGSSDFLGLNHYYTWLDTSRDGGGTPLWDLPDAGVSSTVDPTWPREANTSIVPWGFRRLLKWAKKEYNNFPIMITENGYANHGSMYDFMRVQYLVSYMAEMLKAIYEDGVNVIGYTVWCPFDAFEWDQGYYGRFGLYYVNISDPEMPRTPKFSAGVMANITSSRSLPDNSTGYYISVPERFPSFV